MKVDFDLDLHSLKRLNYIGTTFRTRKHFRGAGDRPSHARGSLETIVSARFGCRWIAVFALDDAIAAHAHMASNAHFGKIVIKP